MDIPDIQNTLSKHECTLFINRNAHNYRVFNKGKCDRRKFPLWHKTQIYILNLVPGHDGQARFLIYDSFTRKKLSIQDCRLCFNNNGLIKKIRGSFTHYIFQVSSLLKVIAEKRNIDEETRFIKNRYSIYNIDTFKNLKFVLGKGDYYGSLKLYLDREFEPRAKYPNSETHSINVPEDELKFSAIEFNDTLDSDSSAGKLRSSISAALFKSILSKNKILFNFKRSKLPSRTCKNSAPESVRDNFAAGPFHFRKNKDTDRYKWCKMSNKEKKCRYKHFLRLFCHFILHLFQILFPSLTLYSISTLITMIQSTFYFLRVSLKSNIFWDTLFMHFSGKNLKNNFAFYSLFTSTLLHSSLGHLLISTIMHFRFSFVMENSHGAMTTLALYFICSSYGMLASCWYNMEVKQANGFAGDWGVVGVMFSSYILNPYLIQSGTHHLTNFIASGLCLFFVKASDHGDQISFYTHIMSSVGGLCIGYLFNKYNGRLKWRKLALATIADLACVSILLIPPTASLIALFVFDM